MSTTKLAPLFSAKSTAMDKARSAQPAAIEHEQEG